MNHFKVCVQILVLSRQKGTNVSGKLCSLKLLEFELALTPSTHRMMQMIFTEFN
jgi:hypothetical protein